MIRGKRFLSMIIAFVMILSSGLTVFAKFSDTSKHWADREITYMVDKGVINGYDDGTFKPDNNMTKAEFYKVINHLMGYEEKAEEVEFEDVKENDWFYEEVATAIAAGYIEDGENLNPNELITREEVARIIGIAYGLEKDARPAREFKDNAKISLAARGYVGALKEKGYIQGYPDGTFRPKNNITRAEAVKMLFNIVEVEGIPEVEEPEEEKPKAPVTPPSSGGGSYTPDPDPEPGPSTPTIKDIIEADKSRTVAIDVYGQVSLPEKLTVVWSDNTTTDKAVTWEIDKTDISVPEDAYLDGGYTFVANKVGAYTLVGTITEKTSLKAKWTINVVNLIDATTGVAIEVSEGTVIDPNAVLVVEDLTDDTSDETSGVIEVIEATEGIESKKVVAIFDITLYASEAKDEKIQPDRKVKVKIPITEAMKAYDLESLQVVYVNDKNEVTILPTTVSVDYLEFETEHFSYYAVVGKEKVEEPELNTDELKVATALASEKKAEDYTEESYAALTEALALPETTQEEIDDKVEAINAAIAGLEVPVSAISVDPDVMFLELGKTATVTATVSPRNATNKRVTWSSSDAGVATVENGIVTAVAVGEATITAKAGSYTATCEVNVVEITVDALDNDYYPAGTTLTFDIKGLIEGENKVGILIHTGAGGFPWASDEEVIDGLDQDGEGLYYTGNTIVNGAVTLRVSGTVQPGLPAGNLWITLPDYGIGIDNAIELKDGDNNSVRVGPMVGTSEDYEYQSIQAAIDAATEGDIIEVAAGTYEEKITINKSIVLLGDPGDPDTVGPGPNAPVIDGQNSVGNGFTIAGGVEDVVIEGFKIVHFLQKSGEAAKTGNAIQAYDGDTTNITIRNNYMYDLGYNGVLVGNNSSSRSGNWTISNNYIEKHRLHAIELINTSDSTVQGNAIQGGGVNDNWNPPFKSLNAIGVKVFDQDIDNITIEGNQMNGFNYYHLGLCNLYASNANLRSVSIINNLISSAGSGNPDMKFEAVSSGAITDTTVTGNTLATFEIKGNVELDLNEVLTSNNFPAGSMVIGNEIKVFVPDEGKVYNKNTGAEYDTIQTAVNGATEGDTILVGPGEYDENLAIAKPLTLIGAGRDVTVVRAVQGRNYNGGAMQSPVVMITSKTAVDGITISGFTFQGHIPEKNPGNPTGNFGGWGNSGLNGLSTQGIVSFDMNNDWPPPERKNITVTNNKFVYCGGVDLYNATGFEISNNIMVRESHQIPYDVDDSRYHDKANGGRIAYLSGCKNGLVQNNVGYTPKDTGVINIAGGSDIEVSDNYIVAPEEPLPGDSGYSAAGINVYKSAIDIEISGNTIKGFRDDPEIQAYYGAAVVISGGSSSTVTQNVFENNDYGVRIKDKSIVNKTDNTFTDNGKDVVTAYYYRTTSGQITNIEPDEVIYIWYNFIIPAGVTEFTFKYGDMKMKASFENDEWTITEVEGEEAVEGLKVEETVQPANEDEVTDQTNGHIDGDGVNADVIDGEETGAETDGTWEESEEEQLEDEQGTNGEEENGSSEGEEPVDEAES